MEVSVAVPRSAVGVVIGKNGEMIKKIQNETGARVQFQQGRDDNPEERMCALTGTMNQIEDARQRIEELIESVLARDSQMGRGRGRTGSGMNGAPYGRSPGGGSTGGWGEYGPGRPSGPSMGMARNGQEKVEYQFLVPSTKTGIIIGKGGEAIKQINQQSGAFCELYRRPPPNPSEKIFIIRGSHDQVEMAKRMISEKLGLDSVMNSQGPMGAPPTQYPLGQSQNPAAYAAQGWSAAAAYQQQWPGQQNDPSKADPNAAAWAAYYQQQQYFQQSGSGAPAAPGAAQAAAPAQDYSAQWAAYYRSMGKIGE